MDPNLLNPNDPATPTANVVVPPVVAEPVTSELPPLPLAQSIPQEPQIQPIQPPVQNTPPPAPVANPISQNAPPAPPPDTSFDGLPKKHLISKKVAAIAVVLFLAVTIPLTVFVTNQQQNTEIGAANTITDVTVVGSFSGIGQIKVATLMDIIKEQNSSDLYNPDTIKIARDIYIERMTLDAKQTELNLSVSQADIDSLANDTGLSQIQAKYELLKQQVILTQVKYVKAVSIGYWTPPPDNAGENQTPDDQAIITKQNDEGKIAIEQARGLLANGQDVLTVASSISNNSAFIDLASVLSMNGSKFALIPDADKQTAAEPVLYEYGDTNFDPKTRDLLFGADVNTPVISQADTSSGGQVVFKVLDKQTNQTAQFNSYKDWLAQQEDNLSTKVNFP